MYFLLFLQHEESYVSLLAACKAGDGQKRLAPSFISKFFKYFPKLADQAIDTLLDLCEEDDPNVWLYPGYLVCVPLVHIYLCRFENCQSRCCQDFAKICLIKLLG